MSRRFLPVSVVGLLLLLTLLAGCVRPGSIQILICVKNRTAEPAFVETVLLDVSPETPDSELISFEKEFHIAPGQLLRAPTTVRNGYYLLQAVAVDSQGNEYQGENGPSSYGARFRANAYPIHVVIVGDEMLTVGTMNRSCAEL